MYSEMKHKDADKVIPALI